MTAIDQHLDQSVPAPSSRVVRWRLVGLVGLGVHIAGQPATGRPDGARGERAAT
jgi:hypothetical protein